MKYIHQKLFILSLIVLIIMFILSYVGIIRTFREDIKFYLELEQLEAVEHQYE